MGDICLEIESKSIKENSEPIDIKVINNTGEELIYKILVGKEGVWETLKDFQKESQIEWMPKEEGDYMIIAQAKKIDSGKPFDFKVTQSLTVGVNEERIIKNLFLNNTELKIGEKITLQVDSSKGPILYRYFISNRDGWQLLKDYTPENSINFTANRGGYFEFLVECKLPNSKENFDDYKTIGFSVKDFKKPEITNFKCLTEDILVENELIFEVDANFEDERTALYKFIKVTPNGKAICIQDYSSRKIVSFVESEKGKYKLLCLIRDMYSSKEYDDRAMIVYDVLPYKNIEIKSFTTDLSSPQVKGAKILMKALVDGGNNLLYRYKVDGPLSDDSGYSRNSTFIWSAKKIGDYKLTLWVKDDSYEGEFEQCEVMDFYVDEKKTKPVRISEVIFDNDKKHIINEPIEIKVLGEGGTSLKYSFTVFKDGKQLEKIRYGNSNWVNFTPEKSGDYEVEVKVKDKYSEKEYDAHTLLRFKVKEYLEGRIEHILVPSKGYFLVGDDIMLEAVAQNTKDTLIKYVTKINDQTAEETDYIEDKKLIIRPKCPGKYVIEMYVKNKKCKSGFDTKRQINIYVNDAPPVTNTKIVSNGSLFKLNEEINFSIESDGGRRVCYEFYIMKNGEWKLMQRYSRKNYYTFIPFSTGNYRMLVLAKSYYKKSAYEDYDILEFTVK